MVINYDLPVEAENYVHRIGRTARAGKTGKAVTLASEQDVYKLPAIERYIGKKIPSEVAMPDLYVDDKSTNKHIREATSSHKRPVPKKNPVQKRDSRNTPPLRQAPAKENPRRSDKKSPVKNNIKKRENVYPQGLSQLSLEERMDFYKKKYDSKTKDTAGVKKSPETAKEKKPEALIFPEKAPDQPAPLKKSFWKRLFGLTT